MGHDTQIIDYLSHDQEQYELFSLRHPRRTLRVLRHLQSNVQRKRSFEAFTAKWLKLTSKRYTWANEATMSELRDQFDCFVCGSDQIWNLDCTQGVVEPFFLSFAGDKRRVAYAPSIAHTSFRPENFDRAKVGALLNRFDSVSVREEETLPLYQPLTAKPIDVVLDPTLLLGADAYEAMACKPVVDGAYIFVYLLRQCPELVASAKAMAEKTGLKVVYVADRTLDIPGGVNMKGIGPDDFLSLISHASIVLANSFHAAVFSVLFHKAFRSFATDKSASRMRGLLSELGIEERCVSSADASPIRDVDWEDVERRLDALREHSYAYLTGALS